MWLILLPIFRITTKSSSVISFLYKLALPRAALTRSMNLNVTYWHDRSAYIGYVIDVGSEPPSDKLGGEIFIASRALVCLSLYIYCIAVKFLWMLGFLVIRGKKFVVRSKPHPSCTRRAMRGAAGWVPLGYWWLL